MLFSVIGWTDRKLNIKLRSFPLKGALYAENILWKRKLRTLSLETDADAGVENMKEEDIVQKSDSAASSTVSETRWIELSKLVIAIAGLCFIYNLNVRNLVEEHELGIKENLAIKKKCLLADLPYNVQSSQNDARAAYGVFGQRKMKDICNVLKNVIRPGAYSLAFCFALKFFLWYEALTLEQKKARGGTRNESGEGG